MSSRYLPARRNVPPPRRPRNWRSYLGFARRHWRWIFALPALGFVVLVAMYITIAVNFVSPDRLILGAKGIEVLDRNGQLIYTFSDEPGSSQITSLQDISPDLINATIATEDANFWKNP